MMEDKKLLERKKIKRGTGRLNFRNILTDGWMLLHRAAANTGGPLFMATSLEGPSLIGHLWLGRHIGLCAELMPMHNFIKKTYK
jgi:hypothetical protein